MTYNDQTLSAPTASYASFGTVSGSNNLTAGGGSIRLVTPFLILIRGAATENRAGYAELTLSFTNKVPEPAAIALLATAAATLWIRDRRRRGS